MLNNFLSGLMFQYCFVLKSITCIIYLIVKETSSEKIEKLYDLSLILKSHACANVTHDVIFTFFTDYWLCKIPYKEISALYLLYGVCTHKLFINLKWKDVYIRLSVCHYDTYIADILRKYSPLIWEWCLLSCMPESSKF